MQLVKLINNHSESTKFYLKEGQLEPIQLFEQERELFFEGMQVSLAKIAQEILKSSDIIYRITQKPNQELEERRQEI